ncbi:response regulator [Desulfovibrio sp. UCD-KL4C]|uniref:response regulator n=1 Tax=Desulfovibrio sp. UCD-KL4C TaxID=2578120 RepID=UPI0025C6EA57|nr:response regulator [Desulfovibrio sp. UCD-KL4C]
MANILVLDDVIDAGVLLKRILERKGHNVLVYSEEEEALKYITKNKIDLAILDIKLKKMTGVEVLELIKEISTDIKVIMLTGYPTLETARASVKHGADEYCVKPIDKEELESKVAEVLGS